MASRAHVQDYYGHIPERPRRAARYPGRNDPVVLPRDRSGSANAILIASGLIATAVIVGGAFAVYAGVPPPPMAQTPTPPLERTYQLDEQPLKAKSFQALSAPASAAPSVETTTEAPAADAGQRDTFAAPTRAPAEPALPDGPAITPRRAAPEALPPPTTADAPPRATPYPDPITTPPDAVAPPTTTPEQPTPLLDPENPYR